MKAHLPQTEHFTPFVTWTVANPAASTNTYNEIQITRTQGGDRRADEPATHHDGGIVREPLNSAFHAYATLLHS